MWSENITKQSVFIIKKFVLLVGWDAYFNLIKSEIIKIYNIHFAPSNVEAGRIYNKYICHKSRSKCNILIVLKKNYIINGWRCVRLRANQELYSKPFK